MTPVKHDEWRPCGVGGKEGRKSEGPRASEGIREGKSAGNWSQEDVKTHHNIVCEIPKHLVWPPIEKDALVFLK